MLNVLLFLVGLALLIAFGVAFFGLIVNHLSCALAVVEWRGFPDRDDDPPRPRGHRGRHRAHHQARP